MCFDIDTPEEKLSEYCGMADFVFHLAGINRPLKQEEFYEGNADLTQRVLKTLEQLGNTCPVLVTSSIQATLENDYGKSKKLAENYVFAYGKKNGAPIYVYRFSGVFGKWCRPNYNSVVATFCHNVANGEQLTINGRDTALKLIYIDDVIQEFFCALAGQPHLNSEGFCEVPEVYETTLGDLADKIESFRDSRSTFFVANMQNLFEKKLYSTYLSYLPEDEFSYTPKTNVDARGSFTELLKTPDRGQVSVNVIKPGITKGQHWHNTKNEKFIVIAGRGVVRYRKVGQDKVLEYPVSEEHIEILDIPVGYTHNIENTGDTNMVAIIWGNELLNPLNPDTYFEEV